MTHDSTQVFSSKVQDYVRFRPGYPEAVLLLLQQDCGLSRDSVVADVGSGTGLLSELFLKNGNLVCGVEPNREMREAGEQYLRDYPAFKSIAGRAESTTLDEHSVDFVVAGQAFHWFDQKEAHTEFLRILRPQGWIVFVWNRRRKASNPFHVAYEKLLMAFGTNLKEIRHDHSAVLEFFAANGCTVKTFENQQMLDFRGLKGRLMSSSKCPETGTEQFAQMVQELCSIFEQYEEDGRICLEYDTRVYYGRLEAEC